MTRKPKQADPDEDPLLAEVKRLSSHHFLRTQNSWPSMVWYNVVRGMAFGFGSLVGATVIVYIVIAVLTQIVSQIDFIPLLSEWIGKIVDIIEESQAGDAG